MNRGSSSEYTIYKPTLRDAAREEEGRCINDEGGTTTSTTAALRRQSLARARQHGVSGKIAALIVATTEMKPHRRAPPRSETTTDREMMALMQLMPAYVDTLRARPESLLTRFLGAHSLRLHGRVIYFVVMKNVFHGARTLHEK